MSEEQTSKTVTVAARSSWRDTQARARDECDDRLDAKADDAVRREERDGWRHAGSSNSSYSVEHDSVRGTYRYSRSRRLRFHQSQGATSDASPLAWDAYRELRLSTNGELFDEPDEDTLDTLLEQRVRAKAPSTERQSLFWYYEETRDTTTGHVIARHPRFREVDVPLSRVVIGDLKITESRLVLGKDVELVGLPLEESINLTPISNCASEPIKRTLTLKYERVTGYRIAFERTLTTKVEVSGKLTYDGSEWGASYERSVELKNTREYTTQETKAMEELLEFGVAAHKKVTFSVTTQRFEARREFTGPIVVDGRVQLVYGDRSQTRNLSDLLSREDRTHHAKGHYGNLDTRVQPIDVTETPC